ncbi:hypothetical protein [Granulicella sp. WH15]|uniref:hypothetical protein n=1 Tax=Granulicella sp. WH15 TaxID=2602070 RepID=UPI00210783D1|nr:hypothetical protein [Granulicella sp. WH15]
MNRHADRHARQYLLASAALLLTTAGAFAQQPSAAASDAALPDDPSAFLVASVAPADDIPATAYTSSSSANVASPWDVSFYPEGYEPQSTSAQSAQTAPDKAAQDAAKAARESDAHRPTSAAPLDLDANGNPIPLERQQPKRILGFMPNFRSVSGGSRPHPPGWRYNFLVATHQAFDYSSFLFLGITSLTAEALNSHPVLGKGVGGFYAYTWRGFVDKTDGTYLSAWLLPSLLHEDTRYYALGQGHSLPTRIIYVIDRQAIARTYGGRETPNIAGLGGKVLTQVFSRYYYPTGATSFGVLATKFAYSAMRDIAFSSVREFYPDIAAHYIRKHREKIAAQAARDAAAAGVKP